MSKLMTFCYTEKEGGEWMPLDFKGSSKLSKLLFENRYLVMEFDKHCGKEVEKAYSTVSVNSLPVKVHSVGFECNGGAVKIWDSYLNGYRPLSLNKAVQQFFGNLKAE